MSILFSTNYFNIHGINVTGILDIISSIIKDLLFIITLVVYGNFKGKT